MPDTADREKQDEPLGEEINRGKQDEPLGEKINLI